MVAQRMGGCERVTGGGTFRPGVAAGQRAFLI